MNDPGGKVLRPFRMRDGKRLGDQIGQPLLHCLGTGPGRLHQWRPALRAQRIWPLQGEIAPRVMHVRQNGADLCAMCGLGPPERQAVQKGQQGRGPPIDGHRLRTVLPADRHRAGNAFCRQMLKQPQEERQILRMDPFFIQCQDEAAPLCGQQKVGILHTLGDALEARRLADIVILQQRLQVFKGDFGINGHGAPALPLDDLLRYIPGAVWRCLTRRRLAPV